MNAVEPADIGLREANPLYRLIAERSGHLFCRLDPGGTILEASASALQVLGYDPAELVGTQAMDLMHPDDRAYQVASYTALTATGATQLPPIITRIGRKDGRWIEVETVCCLTRTASGEVIELQTAAREITSRVDAERAQQASLLAVLEALPEPAVVHFDGKIVTANRAFVALLGWDTLDELLVELRRGTLKLVHPDDRAFVKSRVDSTLLNGRTPEHRFVHRTGEIIPVESTGVPFPFEGVLAALVVIHDLRPRKRLDAERAAADRMATLGRLASGVGHEINNPLTYVLGALDLLRKDIPALARGPAEADALLARVHHALDGAMRVRDIVRDLKTLSSADDAAVDAVDLRHVLDLAAATAAHEIEHRARLVRDDGEIALVVGREGRLIQVFVNLLVNAAQAIVDGDIASNEIRIVTRMAGRDQVTVDVLDTGSGFAGGDAARLFEPFFTTKSGAGTGLGLSIAHRVVSSFGGTIVAESRAPRGACFRVTLPAHANQVVRAVPPVVRAPETRRARVLFADDEPLIRDLASTALDRHDVVTVASGREAIRLLGTEQFDAIVCDLQMPDLGGVDVYEWIVSERPELAGRVVFMTGGAFTERAQRFLERTDRPRIDKPLDLDRINDLVGAIVDPTPAAHRPR